MGFDLGGGVLGDAFGAITNTVDTGTGGWWSDSSTKASAKRNLRYNQWLQASNQSFQKYMAQNAHQMEVQDLINAGLNPALSATGSSAGSIAGKSSAQGTSPGQAVNNLGNIVDSINSLRQTNANITNQGKEADAAIKNAEAAYMNAETQRKLAEEGGPGKLFGTEGKNTASALALTALGLLPFGIGGAFKGIKLANNAYKSWKVGKGFDKFLNSLK